MNSNQVNNNRSRSCSRSREARARSESRNRAKKAAQLEHKQYLERLQEAQDTYAQAQAQNRMNPR